MSNPKRAKAIVEQTVSAQVRGLHSTLKTLPDLAPAPAVNDAFTRLVNTAMQPVPARTATRILAELAGSDDLRDLHGLCAEGEFRLEEYWGARVKNAADPAAELRKFPYYENYRKLAKLEVAALRREAPAMRRVVFVGSGPLPLTAYMLAKYHKLQVTNLDVDGDATCCALEWMAPLLGLENTDCRHMDVRDFTDFAAYDVVIMAALVGLDALTKQDVLNHLASHMTPDQVLLVRSVRGLRGLLYPVVQPADMGDFKLVRAVHPRGEVVNSVLLGRLAA